MASKHRSPASVSGVERLPLTTARVNLGAVVKRVHLHKQRFLLEKDGIPVAALVSVDEFEDFLELRDPKVASVIRESAVQYRAGKTRPARSLLAELRHAKARKSRPRRKT